MLVLSRKLGEAVIIGDGITVNILKIRGRHVSLGVSAPPEVSIVRQEIHGPARVAVKRPERVEADRSSRSTNAFSTSRSAS